VGGKSFLGCGSGLRGFRTAIDFLRFDAFFSKLLDRFFAMDNTIGMDSEFGKQGSEGFGIV
jgi:hypothetical protein